MKTNVSDSNLDDISGKKDKKVHFADTIGLSLVSVYFIRDKLSLNERVNARRRRKRENLAEEFSYEKARLLNFLQPVSRESLIDNLEKNNVCLEAVTLRDYAVLGSIKVKNLAYEKRVFVRWTIDNWETYNETQADYVYRSTTETTDNFGFELRMPVNLEKNFKLEFAICYQVLGVQYWDNNSGDNFRIMWYACSKQTLKRRDLWDIFQSNRYAGFWF